MEKWDTRPFQSATDRDQYAWNVVELASRKHLHSKIHELIDSTNYSALSTTTIQQQLDNCRSQSGPAFSLQLVRSLPRDNIEEREAIVWLLTLLKDPITISPLQHIAYQDLYSRPIRLSAALALAGMGVTHEMLHPYEIPQIYAIR